MKSDTIDDRLAEGFFGQLRRHKMWGYAASHFTISALYTPVATGTGLLVGLNAQEIAPVFGMGEGAQDATVALATAFSSSAIKVVGDLVTNSPVLYQINRQIYEPEGGFDVFMGRYTKFTFMTRGFELLTGTAAIFGMLALGAPFQVAALTNGTLTSVPNNAFKLLSYPSMVLMESPWPKIARGLGQAGMAAKQAAYALLSYMPTTPVV